MARKPVIHDPPIVQNCYCTVCKRLIRIETSVGNPLAYWQTKNYVCPKCETAPVGVTL